MHWMGPSGYGKSKHLASIIADRIRLGMPCSVIDPHTTLVEDVMGILVEQGYFKPPAKRQKVVYLDFTRDAAFATQLSLLLGQQGTYAEASWVARAKENTSNR
jgi:hypothetical protein